LVKRALFSALAISISLIGASGARAQTGPPLGGVLVLVQQKPAVPQSPPAAAPGQIAPVASARPDAPLVPSAEELVSLVRNVLLAVNDANLTGNYTVLRDLSAPIRQQGTDFSIVAVATPRFVQLPTFTPQGYLRVNGEFISSPRITFDIFFQHVAGRWRPYAIGVGVVPVQVNPTPSAEAKSLPKSKGAGLSNQPVALGARQNTKPSKPE